ncbi:polysaccharide pyruvyl transferase family protein [Phenylobacterium sp. SCN 70-31]|uniref:polysaccharide pyruvyl transferase family protein n=1 Tax=Phenylobacterium sp. SCN 70-31 TaxID=1660129 RepID=UPI00086DDED4|nr:polysaccharide pyruvyl transferase family protein [Phenylobacterium sp. SCN 70-31]ODT87851.1 MAG: hypothetical protein ABS78_09715 [Phenylobacterium sp. SCN 70-31]
MSAKRRSDEIVVGLLWHSVNSGNLGVGALTVGNLELARQAAAAVGLRPRFRVLGFLDPGVAPYVTDPDVEIVPLNARAMLPGGRYWSALSDLDCVLDIGGGDSFTDIYGAKRFGFLWLSKAMAIARRKPLVLSPQTIGPFSRQPQSILASLVMNRAELVVARDPLSFNVAKEMASGARLLQAVDVAFALPFERRERPAGPAPVEVGLNVSGLLFNGGYSGANEFGMEIDYAAYTRGLIEALVQRSDVTVRLVSHVNSDTLPQDDDGRIAERLAKEYPQATLIPRFADPSAAKSYISGLDFLVAGRMHACIAAFSSGVPVVPVAYSRKFAGLFEGVLNYPHIVPVTGLDTQAAIAFTLEKLEARTSLRDDIREGTAGVEGLLNGYRDALSALFDRSVAA